jgi:hypothetical protein
MLFCPTPACASCGAGNFARSRLSRRLFRGAASIPATREPAKKPAAARIGCPTICAECRPSRKSTRHWTPSLPRRDSSVCPKGADYQWVLQLARANHGAPGVLYVLLRSSSLRPFFHSSSPNRREAGAGTDLGSGAGAECLWLSAAEECAGCNPEGGGTAARWVYGRFDERGWETGSAPGASSRAHPRLYRRLTAMLHSGAANHGCSRLSRRLRGR